MTEGRKSSALSQDRLRELMWYNPRKGLFINRIDRSPTSKKGQVPGWISDTRYHIIQIDGKNYRAHRLAILYIKGYLPENDVDHIDGDRLNNKFRNLREVSRSCNNVNCVSRNSTLNVTGVRKQGGSYVVNISVNNKTTHVGSFMDFTEAVCHRLAAEQCLDRDLCIQSSAYNYVQEKIFGKEPR